MTHIVVLNNLVHRTVRVQAEAAAKFGDNQRFVQVVVTEFSLLVPHYPILFSKDTDTGAFFCGAMLGIDEGENLFLKEGKAMRVIARSICSARHFSSPETNWPSISITRGSVPIRGKPCSTTAASRPRILKASKWRFSS